MTKQRGRAEVIEDAIPLRDVAVTLRLPRGVTPHRVMLVPDCTVTMRRQLFYHRDKWLTPQMKAFIELAQEKNR